MPHLKIKPTLQDYQKYVSEMEISRGFSKEGALEKCLLLGEEVGELFKAIRKVQKIAIDEDSKVGAISHELADIFVYLCSIANRYNVDLEWAFREKEEENKKRSWQIEA